MPLSSFRMTFHYSTFDKELSYEQTNTCRARDKAYPALSGLDFWHYLGILADSVYFNRPEADQRG